MAKSGRPPRNTLFAQSGRQAIHPKRATTTPKPITTTAGSGSTTTPSFKPDNLSTKTSTLSLDQSNPTITTEEAKDLSRAPLLTFRPSIVGRRAAPPLTIEALDLSAYPVKESEGKDDSDTTEKSTSRERFLSDNVITSRPSIFLSQPTNASVNKPSDAAESSLTLTS